jgi:hypothetical protein
MTLPKTGFRAVGDWLRHPESELSDWPDFSMSSTRYWTTANSQYCIAYIILMLIMTYLASKSLAPVGLCISSCREDKAEQSLRRTEYQLEASSRSPLTDLETNWYAFDRHVEYPASIIHCRASLSKEKPKALTLAQSQGCVIGVP